MSTDKKEMTLKEMAEFIIEELDKPRPEYIFRVSPKANKIIDDTLKKLYGHLIKPENKNDDLK